MHTHILFKLCNHSLIDHRWMWFDDMSKFVGVHWYLLKLMGIGRNWDFILCRAAAISTSLYFTHPMILTIDELIKSFQTNQNIQSNWPNEFFLKLSWLDLFFYRLELFINNHYVLYLNKDSEKRNINEKELTDF